MGLLSSLLKRRSAGAMHRAQDSAARSARFENGYSADTLRARRCADAGFENGTRRLLPEPGLERNAPTIASSNQCIKSIGRRVTRRLQSCANSPNSLQAVIAPSKVAMIGIGDRPLARSGQRCLRLSCHPAADDGRNHQALGAPKEAWFSLRRRGRGSVRNAGNAGCFSLLLRIVTESIMRIDTA
jgi:hypothetical protein